MFGRKKEPKPKQPIVVKVYEHRLAKKVAQMFEQDALRMAADGYEVLSVVGTDQKSGHLLLGGMNLLAPAVLTVTYRLKESQAASA